MAAIVPVAQFQGRFPAKELKEFYEDIGYLTQKTKDFDALQAMLLEAWKNFDGASEDSRPTGTLYSATDLASLRAYLASPERKNEDSPTGKAVSVVESFFRAHCTSLSSTLRDFALRATLESGQVGLLARGIEDEVRYSYFQRRLYNFPEDAPTFMVIDHPVVQRRLGGSWIIDHTIYLHDVINAYACGRPDFARRFFRRANGLSEVDNGSRQHATNLCMAVMYDDSEWKEKALQGMAGYIKKTKAVFDRAFVEFFAGVLHQDAAVISSTFALLAQASPKLMWFRDRNNKRIFCSALQGMYTFARVHTQPEVFERLERPSEAWWWDEYTDLPDLQEYPRPYAGPLFPFSGELSFLNDIPRVIEPLDGDASVPGTNVGGGADTNAGAGVGTDAGVAVKKEQGRPDLGARSESATEPVEGKPSPKSGGVLSLLQRLLRLGMPGGRDM